MSFVWDWAWGIPLIIVLVIAAIDTLPKLVPMLQQETYESMPFAKLHPPVISTAPRWWMISHVLSAMALMFLIFLALIFDLVNTARVYLVLLDLVAVAFLVLILGNRRRLGTLPRCCAMMVNLSSCALVFAGLTIWTVSTNTIVVFVALYATEMFLFGPPLTSAIVTLSSWCCGPLDIRVKFCARSDSADVVLSGF